MRTNPNFLLQELQRCTQQLQRAVKRGHFSRFSSKKRQKWLNRMERLQQALSPLGGVAVVKKALAGAALAVSLTVANSAKAQSFATVQASPFGLNITNAAISFPSFGDIDGDGDLDALVGTSSYASFPLRYFRNDGNNQLPAFVAGGFNNPFSNISPSYLAIPSLVDIDNDGDLDLFFTENYGAIKFYQNTGTPTAPAFSTAGVSSPFGLNTPPGYINFLAIAFADIDNDGDLDMFAGTYDYYTPKVFYYQNTGTPTAPSFAAPQTNPFGIAPTTDYTLPTLVDMDSDGDFDLLLGTEYASVRYFQNTGTPTVPNFSTAQQTNPFGISLSPPASYIFLVVPTFADIDADGDKDLFAGTLYGGVIHYQENTAITFVNTPPVTADTSVWANQNTPFVFNAGNFPFSDVNTNHILTSVRVVTLPSVGTLSLAGQPIVANQIFNVAALNNLTYTPPAGQFGVNLTSFQFEVNDGFDFSTAETMTINVNALPTSGQVTINGFINQDFTFSTSNFIYNDPDNNPLGAVRFMVLPAKGTLKLNGTPITMGQVITAANLGNLTYTPLPNESGTPYSSCLYQVSDGYGFSASAAMLINITIPVGTEQPSFWDGVTLSPNPTTDHATLQIRTQTTEEATLTVVNLMGQTVYQQAVRLTDGALVQLPVGDWANGAYFVRLQTASKIWTGKLLKTND